jgi:hypothetical protein
MSAYGAGDVFPSWEQLLSETPLSSASRPGQARHVRTWAAGSLDEGMSWAEATSWSALAVTCALAASRWAVHLLG